MAHSVSEVPARLWGAFVHAGRSALGFLDRAFANPRPHLAGQALSRSPATVGHRAEHDYSDAVVVRWMSAASTSQPSWCSQHRAKWSAWRSKDSGWLSSQACMAYGQRAK